MLCSSRQSTPSPRRWKGECLYRLPEVFHSGGGEMETDCWRWRIAHLLSYPMHHDCPTQPCFHTLTMRVKACTHGCLWATSVTSLSTHTLGLGEKWRQNVNTHGVWNAQSCGYICADACRAIHKHGCLQHCHACDGVTRPEVWGCLWCLGPGIFLKTQGEFLVYHWAAKIHETTCSSNWNHLSTVEREMDVKFFTVVLRQLCECCWIHERMSSKKMCCLKPFKKKSWKDANA